MGTLQDLSRKEGASMAKQDTSYINWYNSQNYDRILITVPKGTKQMIKEEAKRKGQSTNEFLVSLIPEHLITERIYVKKRG